MSKYRVTFKYDVDGEEKKASVLLEFEEEFEVGEIEDYIGDGIFTMITRDLKLSKDLIYLEETIKIEEELNLEGETKSRRGNILFTPTVYEGMQNLAKMHGTSFNDLLHEVSKEYLLERYEEVKFFSERQKGIEQIAKDLGLY